MIAEIKGKLSQTGSNLTNRLEDNLTGNFFGALRYIPFNLALRNIFLNGIFPHNIRKYIEEIDIDFWADQITFWPYHSEGEIDALIDFDRVTIGIEVKYLHGLSSDDDIGLSDEASEQMLAEEALKSCNQLARESRIVSQKGAGKTKILLFIAYNQSCIEVYENIVKRSLPIIEPDVLFGYISWQTILEELNKMKLENPFHQIIINDLILLLAKKGFESFKDMNVTIDEDIAPDGFYKFNSTKSSMVNFDVTNTINGGLYYEFI
ncbi:hypothetical protein [Ectobacillus sp. sgz5001026]|uniref:hypothetical protein n=1 Tax=Ectobacillus sp. sgz5001026 TaxID=3242473 RepID=UPI0036D3CF14